jgi:hypothetical protein
MHIRREHRDAVAQPKERQLQASFQTIFACSRLVAIV